MKATIIVVKNGSRVSTLEVEKDDLATVQKCVGGWVQRVCVDYRGLKVKLPPGLVLLCNEDGMMRGLPEYRTPFWPWVNIRGNYVIARETHSGDYAPLNADEVALVEHAVRLVGGAT